MAVIVSFFKIWCTINLSAYLNKGGQSNHSCQGVVAQAQGAPGPRVCASEPQRLVLSLWCTRTDWGTEVQGLKWQAS